MNILDRLGTTGDSCIIDFQLTEDRKHMEISEACDGYFSQELTKQEFGEMIKELTALHDKMVEG